MGPGEWIATVVAASGFVGWMIALWIRVGRILQRIDDLVDTHHALRTRLDDHETLLTRLEVVTQR